ARRSRPAPGPSPAPAPREAAARRGPSAEPLRQVRGGFGGAPAEGCDTRPPSPAPPGGAAARRPLKPPGKRSAAEAGVAPARASPLRSCRSSGAPRVFVLLRASLPAPDSPAPVSPARPAGTSPLRAAAEPPRGGRRQRCWWGALAVQPAGNMATGGYRSAGGSTTDFLEEWKAKREKMRAKQAPPAPGAPGGGEPRAAGGGPSAELNNSSSNLPPERAAPPAGGALNCVSLASAALGRGAPAKEPPPPLAGSRGAEPAAAPGSPEGEEKLAAKGKSSGPSARKGKGQIEKRKLREKRRSTGVVNIPAAEVSGVGGRRGRGAAPLLPASAVRPCRAARDGPRAARGAAASRATDRGGVIYPK
ncbi:hypothetical protein DV515_00004538, partial [Chloebia gouldiae]